MDKCTLIIGGYVVKMDSGKLSYVTPCAVYDDLEREDLDEFWVWAKNSKKAQQLGAQYNEGMGELLATWGAERTKQKRGGKPQQQKKKAPKKKTAKKKTTAKR